MIGIQTVSKGETAVLTAIEKDYGEQYINRKIVRRRINAKFAEINGYKDPDRQRRIDMVKVPSALNGTKWIGLTAMLADGESSSNTEKLIQVASRLKNYVITWLCKMNLTN